MNENVISRQSGSLLKGLAIIMIMVQHVGQAFKIGVVNPLGPIGVFIFLFMSGYGLTCSYMVSGRKYYFRKRFIKVYGLYLASLLIFLALHFVMFKQTFTIEQIAKYMFLIDYPQGSHWYLALMFLWYFVFYIYTFCIGTRYEMVGLVAATAIVLAIIGGNKSVVWQMFSFQLGVLFSLYGKRITAWVTPRRKWGGYSSCSLRLSLFC